MKFTIKNKILTTHLQKVNRLLSKNAAFPILENILIQVKNEILSLTTTNLEVELISKIKISNKHVPGSTTVSGKKLLDICKNSLHTADIEVQLENNKIHITTDNSFYILNTLPVDMFPDHHIIDHTSEFFIAASKLKNMIEKTEFSMGKQDVRYYFNGMLLEKKGTLLFSVTTDGYRLSRLQLQLKNDISDFSIIIQRTGIVELYKLLQVPEQLIHVLIGSKNIRIYIQKYVFTAQLIEGQYPDYKHIFIKNKSKPILCNCSLLKKSLLRTSILTHDKFHGVEIKISHGQFKVLSSNTTEEVAEDSFSINYSGNNIEISVNVYYILDVLNAISSENILLFINQSQSLIQIEPENNSFITYVIMLLKR
ncbi:MAG: DNA polymerase III subunit beta [Buchnera aphidicola (Pentalonia nigronervosa)]|jgi:DNA polymerase-3 subunit beta|uniref:Beta sliding clamp n=1 Tax=Buchnera aphidicola (Pentalonia nigronervosa) TaxID=1309793 RepID=A0A7H1AZ64_9GAMM|nr:MAG: DNA polymerase III subunit beta [Buchnera aphidicola (Pentalonia nigronervosa)]